VQDTYLKAFRAAERFEPGTNLRAWLFTILHNTARNRVRDRAKDVVDIDSEIVDGAPDAPRPGSGGRTDTPETLLLRDTLAPELQAAVDALPEAFRQAVWLRDVEEFTYAEIAAMLGIPAGTVMSRISRGRHLLFERLNPARDAELPEISAVTAKP
jgi:RNA polymerase sigma-70 factor (ECF subfamily)